jgi:carotenoid 1,2-hydratase
VNVDLAHPQLKWQGHGYLDSNEGDEPVDRPFQGWDGSRARLSDGSTAVLYDLQALDGSQRLIAERFMPDGQHQPFAPPPRVALPGTLWRVHRQTRADESDQPARLSQTLEDTPFYARSLVDMPLCGERVTAVHETLTPQRLKAWPMRFMLPWRMPRLA